MSRALEIWNIVLKEDMKNVKLSNWSDNACKAMNIYAIEILQNFKDRICYSSLSIDIELEREINELKSNL